jgi:hypothetical protein
LVNSHARPISAPMATRNGTRIPFFGDAGMPLRRPVSRYQAASPAQEPTLVRDRQGGS